MGNQPDSNRWKDLADDLGIPEANPQAEGSFAKSGETPVAFPAGKKSPSPVSAGGPRQVVSTRRNSGDDDLTFGGTAPMAPEVEIEEIVEIEAPRMVAQPVEARSSDDLGFGNGDEQRNREAGDSREENGAKDVDSEGEGDGEEGEEEVRTVVFSTPEEAAECESQPLPDPDGDEPVEEIDLSKWDVPNWQVLIDSLYRPDR